MKQLNKIAIIGVGLIGGSIGLAIKKSKLANEVIGVFRHKATLTKALRHKAVDRGVLNVKDGVGTADLVIIAAPVHSIPALAVEAARYSKKGAVITDVGSTKLWLVDKVEKELRRFPAVSFVGSHPMAGSEHTGVEFAKSGLLKGTPCIVTKTKRTNRQAMKKVIDLWKSLGAKVKVMSPAEHDRSISFVSHLPHLVAFSLAGAVPERYIPYAAEGFKDTTRVASSDPRLWADIFLTNKKEVSRSARIFEKNYKRLLKALSGNDYSRIVESLARIKSKRDRYFCEEGK